MGLFSRKKLPTAGSDVLQRPSCTGCSSCFTMPIESMPSSVQKGLEGVREKLIEARKLYLEGNRGDAAAAARDVKRLVGQLSSSGDFKSSIDSMFAAHVPESEVQMFIARS